MPAKLKLTYDLVAQIVELKRDGLCDADIIAAIGVHPGDVLPLADRERERQGRGEARVIRRTKDDMSRALVSPSACRP